MKNRGVNAQWHRSAWRQHQQWRQASRISSSMAGGIIAWRKARNNQLAGVSEATAAASQRRKQ